MSWPCCQRLSHNWLIWMPNIYYLLLLIVPLIGMTHEKQVSWTENYYHLTWYGPHDLTVKSPTIQLFVQQHGPANFEETQKLALCEGGIHQSQVDTPHKGPVMWKVFPYHDVIMVNEIEIQKCYQYLCIARYCLIRTCQTPINFVYDNDI